MTAEPQQHYLGSFGLQFQFQLDHNGSGYIPTYPGYYRHTMHPQAAWRKLGLYPETGSPRIMLISNFLPTMRLFCCQVLCEKGHHKARSCKQEVNL